MKRVLLFLLFIFGSVVSFAQISNTADVMIRSIGDYCYPKRTDVAVIDDKAFVLHSAIIVDGRYKEAFYLVQEYTDVVAEVIIDSGHEVYDIDVCGDSLFFAGRRGNDLGFVAKAEINNFFATGTYDIMYIREAYMILKIKAYLTNSGSISATCVMKGNSNDTRDALVQIPNMNLQNYTICRINPRPNNRESACDILEYSDKIILAGYTNDTLATSYGWTVRVYDKSNIAQNLSVNGRVLYNQGYVNTEGFPFLAKSKDEKNLVLVSIIHNEGNDPFLGTMLSIFDLSAGQGTISCNNRYKIVPNNIPISMLWGADMTDRGGEGNYDLPILSYSGMKTTVFSLRFPNPEINLCNIYRLSDTAMFSSIKTYSNKYFVCVGDRNNGRDVTTWDRNIDITYNDCDLYDSVAVERIEPRLGLLQVPNIPDYETSSWNNVRGEKYELRYKIRCDYKEFLNQLKKQ